MKLLHYCFLSCFLISTELSGAAGSLVAPQPTVSVLSTLYRVTGAQDISALRDYLAANIDAIDHTDSQGWTLMHHAAFEGLLPVVQVLQLAGASTSIRDRAGLLPLDYAEFGGHLETAQFLREENTTAIDIFTAADANAQQAMARLLAKPDTRVNARNAEGKTALHLTAQAGYLYTTLLLMAAEADLWARDNDGKTPYDLAAEAGQAEVASVLLEEMVGVDKKDDKGWPPLNWAIVSNSEERVEELLAKGAKIGEGCQNALEICLVMDNLKMFRRLLQVSGVDVGSSRGDTALMGVSRRGNEPAVDILLQYKANPNVADTKDGNTPLRLAAEKNYVSIVVKLLENGALPNTVDKLGNTATVWAAFWGQTGAVRALHAGGADINLAGSGGMTALMWTVFWREKDTTRVLLELGADTSMVADNGNTVLTWAALRGDVELVQLLLPYYDTTSAQGQVELYRALIYALQRDDKEMEEILLAHSNDSEVGAKARAALQASATKTAEMLVFAEEVLRGARKRQRTNPTNKANGIGASPEVAKAYANQPLSWAIANNRLDTAEILLGQYYYFAKTNAEGDPPVIEAIKREANQILVLLLSRGADPNHADIYDIAPILWAVRTGNKEALKILLAWRANPDAVDSNGFTPLMLATDEGYLEMIEPLLEYQADTSIVNIYGEDVLTFAEKNKRRDIAAILRRVTGAE